MTLFDSAFLKTLESFRLATRRSVAGATAGQRRSTALGASIELADFRRYTAGDDYRRIDWNAFARLERLFLRVYRADESLSVRLLLDGSASMLGGEPAKHAAAARIAGALGFIALQSEDQVSLAVCRDGAVDIRQPRLVGQPAAWALWRALEAVEPGGTTDLDASLGACARTARGRGLTVVFSDLLSPGGYQAGVGALLAARQEVVLVHVLAPEELDPHADALGDWRLVDGEGDGVLDVTVTARVLEAYRRRAAAYVQEVATFCRRRGATYVLVSSDVPLRDVLVHTLRQAGVLA